MALPIKANDTQEGCNPIASNCVIWQGPDIPCIKLCKGDTISDVSAKLAEKLCTILEYLEVSAYDLSCFNPICPSPKDFQELIQLLIDRICAINDIVNPTNGGSGGGGTVGCPDCVVQVAQCLQRPDALGNITATLQLKDYVILIGNEICSILTSLSSLDSRVSSLESAVTNIENNCCNGGGGTEITMPASKCLGTADGTPIVDYLVVLDNAFCDLTSSSGNPADVNTALGYKCIDGTDTLPSGTGTWNSIPGWINAPANLAQAVQDLWLVVCQQNDAIIALNTTVESIQAQLETCCNGNAALCTSTVLKATADWNPIQERYYITFTGDSFVPAGYNFCTTPDSSRYRFHFDNDTTVSPWYTITGGNQPNQIHLSNYGPWITTQLLTAYQNAQQVSIEIEACIWDETYETDQCTISCWIANVEAPGFQGIAPNVVAGGTPENPEVTGVLYPPPAGYPVVYDNGTEWTMFLRLGNNNGPIVASEKVSGASNGLPIQFTFNSNILPGQSYGMTVDIQRGNFAKIGVQAVNNAVTPSAAP